MARYTYTLRQEISHQGLNNIEWLQLKIDMS